MENIFDNIFIVSLIFKRKMSNKNNNLKMSLGSEKLGLNAAFKQKAYSSYSKRAIQEKK